MSFGKILKQIGFRPPPLFDPEATQEFNPRALRQGNGQPPDESEEIEDRRRSEEEAEPLGGP